MLDPRRRTRVYGERSRLNFHLKDRLKEPIMQGGLPVTVKRRSSKIWYKDPPWFRPRNQTGKKGLHRTRPDAGLGVATKRQRYNFRYHFVGFRQSG